MDKAKMEVLKERLVYKLTSSRTILSTGITVLITVLLLTNEINEANFVDALKWVWISFFGSKAFEKSAQAMR
jgi:hypothetical protein